MACLLILQQAHRHHQAQVDLVAVAEEEAEVAGEVGKKYSKTNMKNKKHEILLGLTTTPNSDWHAKVEELKKFKIKKVALFPTFLSIHKRKELYELLDEIKGLKIPHVHLREQDVQQWEMEWYLSHGAKVFNIHMGEHNNKVLKKYKDCVFVENHTFKSIPEKQLIANAGICLDFQHWKRAQTACEIVFKHTKEYAEKFTIGCCHVSPLPKKRNFIVRFFKKVGGHYMISIDEFDYLLEFKKYLPKYISLEVENSFEKQLKVKKYLEKILNI
jgi:hypothetical protein